MSVEVGEETEPILLNIALPDGGDSLIRGFSKRMLLDEVTNMACEEFNLERSCVVVQRLVGKGTEIMISLSLSLLLKALEYLCIMPYSCDFPSSVSE